MRPTRRMQVRMRCTPSRHHSSPFLSSSLSTSTWKQHMLRCSTTISSRKFTVLALESSADDTCAAVVNSSRRILSNVVIKQHHLHEGFGGIHPMRAIEAHQRNMPIAVRQALREANVDVSKDINGIAFTRGPGMGGCLSVGSNAAKTLASALNLPLVGVHHMQAHALTPLLTSWPDVPKFPFLTLLISGGHTLLLLATSLSSFRILATTLDESIGRTFDKVSRMLELKWTKLGPGAALEEFCAQSLDVSLPDIPPFPRPMKGKLGFSYASLHSHVERYIQSRGGVNKLDLPTKLALGRAFQTAAVIHLVDKFSLALDWCFENKVTVQDLVVSGGVASNTYLQERLSQYVAGIDVTPISLHFPPPFLCTDNAVMIGWASMPRFLSQDHDDYTIDLRPNWSINEL